LIVKLSDDAEQDLLDGVAFYDQQGSEVGDYFLDSMTSDLRSLSVLGGVHAKRYGYHCMGAKRFPYAVYYFILDEIVSIVAILDERRDPDWIKQRLGS
jgi:plasmid stabilization system protein ParE